MNAYETAASGVNAGHVDPLDGASAAPNKAKGAALNAPASLAVRSIVDHIDHFQRRVIQDALLDGSAAYWRRRAETFEWARPRPGDYRGQATQQQLAALDQRCVNAAEACRKRAVAAPLHRAEVAALMEGEAA